MTKILVLSDIHGNAHALEAVLKAAPPHDEILCLGDIVGYGARPNQCCELLREHGAISLLGNHDAAVLGQISTEWFNHIAQRAVSWTQDELTNENRNWLEKLRPAAEFGEWGFQAVHGSLREPLEEYITGQNTARPTLNLMSQPLCFYGHTHVAEAYQEFNTTGRKYRLEHSSFVTGGSLTLRANEKTLLNPGSVGQPRDGNPLARAAIYDIDTASIEVLTFDYEIEAAQHAILHAGLPEQLAMRLAYGR